MTEVEQVDVSEMVAVHDVFRDTFTRVPSLIGGVQDGDEERLTFVENFYQNILAFLQVHHHGEEALIFPVLRERCEDNRVVIERVASQHGDVEGLISNASVVLGAWASGEAASGNEAVSALGQLDASLRPHLDEEERVVLPLCAAHMSAAEWGALPGHAMASFEGDKPWLILGLIRERFSQRQRDQMLAHMPPPAVEMWTNVGEASFQGFMVNLNAD